MSALLKAWLLADASIATLVGTRIYLQTAPPAVALPYARLTTISAVPEQTHAGMLDESEDHIRVQIDIWAADLATAGALKALARARVGQIGTVPVADYTEPHDPETGRWRQTLDVQFYPVDVPI